MGKGYWKQGLAAGSSSTEQGLGSKLSLQTGSCNYGLGELEEPSFEGICGE